jgi:hypothetical protein
LAAWSKKDALKFHSSGRLLKVKIAIKDIGAIVKYRHKIRCTKFKVIEEVN